MYLNESEEYKEETALLIEEFLNQRILGMKNEVGVYITPAFPKLIYVLEEDNITEDSDYWYLTELAAKCTAKRMVPDYVSEKVMKSLKIDKNGNGQCYPLMGCVDGKSVIDYKIDNVRYVESFERAWDRLSDTDLELYECDNSKESDYINTYNVSIYDHVVGDYVNVERFIRNTQYEWLDIVFTNGRHIKVTDDHVFEVDGIGEVYARDLEKGYVIKRLTASNSDFDNDVDFDVASWFDGLVLCDGCYDGALTISLGYDEKDIISMASKYIKDIGYDATIKIRERGKKGNYKDICVRCSKSLLLEYTDKFEGVRKINRHIPNYIFNSSRNVKMSFLAGMIDADGYINNSGNSIKVQIGSTNEELATQQMLLAIDLGMDAVMYKNKYSKKKNKIRYRVEFKCTEELINYLVSKKKIDHFDKNHKFLTNTGINSDICEVKTIIYTVRKAYSYDVTCDSHHFTVNGLWSHNCRSALTPYLDENGNPKYYGRFNSGVVTVNLPDIAFSSGGDYDKFWKIFDERTELCHRALQARHERLANTVADSAPIMWRYGALARLEKGKTIHKLLHNGYSTLSLGYAGLYECVKYMTGHSHTDGNVGEKFGLDVMQALNDKCNEWKAEENIDYSLYGTPIESTTYKFAKCLKKRFGDDIFVKLDGEDRDYITNSYHVPVFEEIDPFEKLAIESKFQRLSPGGAISYVECADLTNNTDVVLEIMKFIYDNIMYAELNTKSDYCHVCGYDGEIKIIDENGELIWECPNCGNRDQSKMNVARRTCGLTL